MSKITAAITTAKTTSSVQLGTAIEHLHRDAHPTDNSTSYFLLIKPREFLSAIEGFRDDLVVGAECMFTWYWLADLCLDEKIKFSVGDFLSYARLVTPKQTSDGKVTGHSGAKIGNVHLKWAFSEAVLWMLRHSEDAKAFLKRKEKKYGKARAMTMLARKIARAVYQMLKRKEPFDAVKFFAS
jgi:hypothetical protein